MACKLIDPIKRPSNSFFAFLFLTSFIHFCLMTFFSFLLLKFFLSFCISSKFDIKECIFVVFFDCFIMACFVSQQNKIFCVSEIKKHLIIIGHRIMIRILCTYLHMLDNDKYFSACFHASMHVWLFVDHFHSFVRVFH